MTLERLGRLLERIGKVRALVVGDFYLDQYWVVDPSLEERSLETGRPAHQVAAVRHSPGAAGTVTNNLCALGLARVEVAGLIGEDGNGWQLRAELERRGALTSGLLASPIRLTPVYTKPMVRTGEQEEEGDRFDIRSRTPTPLPDQLRLVSALRKLVPEVDAVAIMDQVEEDETGVVGTLVRDELCDLATAFPGKPFLADSRARIGAFRQVLIKPNRSEAARAAGIPAEDAQAVLSRLHSRSGRPVFMTLAEAGMASWDGERLRRLSAVPVTGPTDPVGAGDSASAALLAGLAAGATIGEAMQLALLAASVTVRKLGTTGTASPDEILDSARTHCGLLDSWEA